MIELLEQLTLMPVITVHLQKSIHPLLFNPVSAVFCGKCKDMLPIPPRGRTCCAAPGMWSARSPQLSASSGSASAAESHLTWDYTLSGADCIRYQGVAISAWHKILWWVIPRWAEESLDLNTSSTSFSDQACFHPFLIKIFLPISLSVSTSTKPSLWQVFCNIRQKQPNWNSMG